MKVLVSAVALLSFIAAGVMPAVAYAAPMHRHHHHHATHHVAAHRHHHVTHHHKTA